MFKKNAVVSSGFYILFAYNNVIEIIFFRIGKTSYMLFQSEVVINTVFYGCLFILYLLNIYQPTLMLIAIMFALDIPFASIRTFGILAWMLKKENISICKV